VARTAAYGEVCLLLKKTILQRKQSSLHPKAAMMLQSRNTIVRMVSHAWTKTDASNSKQLISAIGDPSFWTSSFPILSHRNLSSLDFLEG
jgi:hypothetical protein